MVGPCLAILGHAVVDSSGIVAVDNFAKSIGVEIRLFKLTARIQ